MPKESVAVKEQYEKVYEHLKKVRASTTVEIKPTPMMKTEIRGFDGTMEPLKIRYYQVQGIYHLLIMNRMVLGDGTGLGKCTTGSTLLSTSQGLLKIEALRPKGAKLEGFYPLTFPISVWTGMRMAPVKSFYWGGSKPTIRVVTRNGYQIEGSLVHPVYIRKGPREGFTRLPELKVGDHVCIDRGKASFPFEEPATNFDLTQCGRGFTYPAHLTPKLATLLGWLISEGNRHPTSIQVTQHVVSNPDNHREIRDLFYEIFGWKGNHNSKAKDRLIAVTSKDIRRYLISCGVREVLSAEKSVPDLVMRGTRESVRCFLSALIEAECSVASGGGVEFSTASKELAKQVQLLLLRFGVVSSRKPKKVKGYTHTYWRVSFFGDDARVFQREIGLRSKRKLAELKSSLARSSNPNKDLVPNLTSEIGALKELILQVTSKNGSNSNRIGSGLKQFGECFRSTLKNILCGYRDPSYQWLQKLLDVAHSVGLSSTEEYRKVLQVTQRHFFYDPIVSIEYGSAPVMDLEIDDPEHCFSGNGFINHNTLQAIGALCYIWERDPEVKVVVVCPKSAIGQWASEIDKFAIGVKTFQATGTLDKRKAIYQGWANHKGPAVLILNYALVIRDWDQGITKAEPPPGAKKGTVVLAGRGYLDELTSKMSKLSVIFDEIQACKNPTTKTHQTCRFLSDRCKRVWGLTATLLQNHLIEGFGIFKVIRPQTFGSKSGFINTYCVTELRLVRGNARIQIIATKCVV
jgi:intein/homing endonuclease